MTAPEPDDEAERRLELRETYRQQVLASIGGWQGALITAIPTVVFVVVNAATELRTAIIAALGATAVLVGYRLARHQSIQQALSGALGVGIAALIAARSGQARGYFLLGIWGSFLYAIPLAGSLLFRRPIIGLIWEFLDPTPDPDNRPWYRRAPLLRGYVWATLVWTAATLARGIVQLTLYNRNATGWLAFARISMGYPLTIVAFGLTFLLVSRARRRLQETM